jgi:hypothetical protein
VTERTRETGAYEFDGFFGAIWFHISVEYSLSGAARFLPIHNQTSIKRDRTAQFYHILKPNATLASAAIASLGSSVLVTYLPPPHNVAKTEKIKLKCRTETRTYPATCTWERVRPLLTWTAALPRHCSPLPPLPLPRAGNALFSLSSCCTTALRLVSQERSGGEEVGRTAGRRWHKGAVTPPTITVIGWEAFSYYKTIIKQR